MIPWYYAAVTAGVGSLVGSVLMIVYYRNYSALAETAELYAADQASKIAQSVQRVSEKLKTPGK